MPEYVRRVKEVRRTDADDDLLEPPVDHDSDRTVDQVDHTDTQSLAARIVWYIAGILLAILALRFLLALLGANPSNAFAAFIYSISYPFVAPFFGLFSYNVHYGVARFESYTLVAMVVYALIAYGIARLITLNRPATNAY